MSTAVFSSLVGPLRATCEDGALVDLSFAPSSSRPTPPGADDAVLALARAQLAEYFAGTRTRFDIPLRLKGADFELRVWRALCDIPYGQTTSYGRIAAAIGEPPEAARAVGSANGRNPIPIIVPCHRVIGGDGSLVGYGGGLRRKRILLDLEAGRLRLPV